MNKKGMDKECIELCEAMNLFPHIQTTESCSGHGKDDYCIWFLVKKLSRLPQLLYWFNGCHSGCYGWRCFVKTDCAMSPVTFCVEGPTGEKAYRDSKIIAKELREYIRNG